MESLQKSNSFQIPGYILNDLCTRFIINIPDVESQDIIRVFFQIELAHWFYLDFYCPENTGLRLCSLKEFASQMFVFCPTLSMYVSNFDSIFEQWKEYKQAVPTYGAILLDPTLQYCLLVQGYWVKASWGFPKGKVNQDERPLDCAIREVLEETGLDTQDLIDENEYLEYRINDQISRLYIITGVSRDTHFQAKTRQEIKSFSWFRVDYLPTHKKDNVCKQHLGLNPNAFFMVIPFVKELKARISQMLSNASDSGRGQRSAKVKDKSILESKQASEKKRLKQQQQFSQQMHQELQDYGCPKGDLSLGKPKTDIESVVSQFPSGVLPPTSVSPRQPKWTSQSSKPCSPSKKSTTVKQLKILKRDGTMSKKINAEISNYGLLTYADCHEDIDINDFSCSIWTNFKLDTEQVLAAMLLTKHN